MNVVKSVMTDLTPDLIIWPKMDPMGRLALFPKNINLLFMLVGISCNLFFSSTYMGKLNEEKKD